jgi:hypothetical protein
MIFSTDSLLTDAVELVPAVLILQEQLILDLFTRQGDWQGVPSME